MLNLTGFTSPPTQFDGLQQMGNTIERNKYRDEQAAYRQDQLQQQKDGKRIASMKFLTDYLDPKQNLTGSPYDPQIVSGMNQLLQEGMKLASEGADMGTIMTALGPSAGKMFEYAQKAKLVSAQKEETIKQLKGVKGIDLQKFSESFNDAAFYETDEKGNKKMRDLSTVDPTQMYGDAVLRDGDVWTKEGLDEYVSKAGKDTKVSNIYKYNKMGGREHTKAKIVSPSFMVSDTDEKGVHQGFVPDYEVAMDEGKPMEHEFVGSDGKATKAPIRMVKDSVFNSLPNSYKGYLRQEVRKYAKEHGQTLNSKQAENLAKTLAYDDLKEHGRSSSTIEELYDNKPSTQEIKINMGYPAFGRIGGGSGRSGGGSGAGGEVTINDTYGSIAEKLETSKAKGKGGLAFTALDADEQDTILSSLQKSAKGVDVSNIYLSTDTGDGIRVYAAKDILNPDTMDEKDPTFKKGDLIKTFSFKGVNMKTQADVKAKRAVVEKGSNNSTKSTTKKDPLGLGL